MELLQNLNPLRLCELTVLRRATNQLRLDNCAWISGAIFSAM